MERSISQECTKKIGKKVLVQGWIHNLRLLGKINFLILRDRGGLLQIVVIDKKEVEKIKSLQVGSVLSIEGEVKEAKQTELGVEISNPIITVITPVKEVPPVEYNKKDIHAELDTILDNRVITLRNEKLQAIFKVQATVKAGYREFMNKNDFIEISSPKLLAEASEGGANFFEIPYFYGKKAYLAQSPQFYKQIMVGVFERVFEIAPVYRAEKHRTSRHMSEYVSMDAEFGFIESWEDILEFSEQTIKYIIEYVWEKSALEMKILGAVKPVYIDKTPRFKISEIHEIYFKEKKIDFRKEMDLEPEEERFICEYAAKKYKSDLVFATHFPTKKRPFYTKISDKNEEETYSADMLFRGVEIMTGGQRENRYEQLVKQAKLWNVSIDKIKGYLDCFKYGMPPEGGFAMGSERITQKLLGLSNVKEATLFPRDTERLTP
jgi:nondiscriminating aspartyl-tRNA synthetase